MGSSELQRKSSDFIEDNNNDNPYEGSGGGHVEAVGGGQLAWLPKGEQRVAGSRHVEAVGGGFQFDDPEAEAAIAQMIAEEISREEPDVRPPDEVRRERLMDGDDALPHMTASTYPSDPDLERAIEESRLLYEVEENLRGDADSDPDYEKAIAESIEIQIRHEEEVTKAAMEEERRRRSAECDLIVRRLKTMFGGKPEILAKVDPLFRAYIECANGPYIYLSPEEHLFFGDLMDYLYTLPAKLMGRSILSKEVYERLSKYMVIRDPEITPEDQYFMRTHWVEGMDEGTLRQRWATLKSIFE